MRDAGLPGARTAPDEREVRFSSERDRQSVFLGDKKLLYINEPGRWMVWRVRREAAGTQHRGSCEAGAGVGAALNITALVSEKCSKANTQTPLDRSVCRSLMPSEAPELSRFGGRGSFPPEWHILILFRPFISCAGPRTKP